MCANDLLLLDTGYYYCTEYHPYHCSRKLSASVCSTRADR
jgi:hypothetical protein